MEYGSAFDQVRWSPEQLSQIRYPCFLVLATRRKEFYFSDRKKQIAEDASLYRFTIITESNLIAYYNIGELQSNL